jgi:hypothetical protein
MIKFTNANGTSIEVVPSQMKWSLQDVSAANSGRNTAGKMFKNRVTQKRKLEFEFTGWDWTKVSQILQVVNSEYITVRYPDMMTGTVQTRTFYVGDR